MNGTLRICLPSQRNFRFLNSTFPIHQSFLDQVTMTIIRYASVAPRLSLT